MRKIILEEWLSMDGYVSDKKGKLDFFPSTEANKYADKDQLQFMGSIDTILLGRVTYELFAGFWPTATTDTEIIADQLNTLPKIVFSNTLAEAPWGKWTAAQVVRGDAVEEIRKLKQKEGKNMVLWGSITLAQSLMRENLVDEYRLQICPTATGGGRVLFPDTGVYTNFRLVDSKKYDTGVMMLHYEVQPVKPPASS